MLMHPNNGSVDHLDSGIMGSGHLFDGGPFMIGENEADLPQL
jgi:hypothetical protein